MISNIKNKIGILLAKRRFVRHQKHDRSFQRFFSESKDVLIILPNLEKDFIVEVFEIVRFTAIHKKKLFLIHKPELQKYLPTDFEYSSLVISELDKSRLELPTKDLVNRIKKYTFDLVIDLNLEDDLFSSALSNIPLSDFRIGFIKRNSDLFYNYQIPREINSEKSYRNLLNSLRMF